MEQDEFKVKILIDESLSVDMLMKKEMRVEEFDALIEKAKRISKASGYSYETVSNIKGKGKYKAWTDEEIASLKEDFPVKSKEEMENKYGRSYVAIANRAHTFGIKKNGRANKLFSGNEEDEIRKMVKNHVTYKEMASKLNKTFDQIKNKLTDMRNRGVL